MRLYGLVIFLSAFLLFEVEPIIAKIILPWFGGAAGVWITCLLFFQVVLLLGYTYAFGLVRYWRPKLETRIHAVLLALSLLTLPILPGGAWKPGAPEHPAWQILLLLAATVGLPYLLLSATSPLLQSLYAAERPGVLPYRLFALSNAGSMLALVIYPVLVEPEFSTRHQATGWSWAYAGVAVLCSMLAFRSHLTVAVPETPADPGDRPARTLQLLWVALAACGSALLLSVTNHLTQNVAAVPFLWVLPLGLYLLSFILCFEGRGWYRRNLFLRLFAVALGGMTYALAPEYSNARLILLLPLFSAGLFICCMVCHGELERLKPAPEHLTSFYLMASLGGALGGLFVGLLAPHIFSGYFELPVTLGVSGVLTLVVLHRDPGSVFYRARWQGVWLAVVALCAVLVIALFMNTREQRAGARVMVRNFYGSLRVTEESGPDVEHEKRRLVNGTILHGTQFLEAGRRTLPTTYYGPESGVGLALKAAGAGGAIRAGVIGLGVGTIAAYGRPGDEYTFYEINPLVIQLARTEFTFLADCRAKVKVVPGDGRLSLEREPPQNFDLLAIDAFSGDSIPIHLLTREAVLLYFRHLKPDGILAVHVTNRYLDLRPVVMNIAASIGKPAAVVHSEPDDDEGTSTANWVLVSDRRDLFQEHEIGLSTVAVAPNHRRVWTDDYSNLLGALK